MTSNPERTDIERLKAQLLAERQAHCAQLAAHRSIIDAVLEELTDGGHIQEASLRTRLERVLGQPPKS